LVDSVPEDLGATLPCYPSDVVGGRPVIDDHNTNVAQRVEAGGQQVRATVGRNDDLDELIRHCRRSLGPAHALGREGVHEPAFHKTFGGSPIGGGRDDKSHITGCLEALKEVRGYGSQADYAPRRSTQRGPSVTPKPRTVVRNYPTSDVKSFRFDFHSTPSFWHRVPLFS
jgi:hypothetical protein